MAYNRILGTSSNQKTTYNRILGSSSYPSEDTDYNKGGLLGGAKYLGGQLASGAFGVLEGAYDFTAGGLSSLFGNDEYAKKLMENDIAGDWSQQLTEEYNPSKGMEFAGNVASGIGQSAVGAGVALGAGALVVASGGTLAPAAAGLIAGGTIGIGAAGMSTAQAYKKTGKLGLKEYAYGGASGLIEGGLEAFTGAAGKVASRAISPLAKTAAKSAVRQGILKTMLSEGAGEFVEESLSTMIDPYLQRGLGIDKNAKNATPQKILYSGMVGFASGALMSGGTSAATNIRNAGLGTKIMSNGKAEATVQNAKTLVDYTNQAEDVSASPAVLKSLKGTYDKYTSLKNKNGTEAKMLLGEMSRSLAYIEVSKGVQASKASIIDQADNIVQILQPQGFEYTAEDIKANKDDILTKLAIEDFAGKFALPTEQYTAAVRQGQMAQSEANYVKWQSEVDDATKQELGQRLGIDLNTATYYDMQQAMEKYDPAAIEAQRQADEQAKAAAQETAERTKAEARVPITAAAKQSYKMSQNAEKAMASFRSQFSASDTIEVTPKGTARKQVQPLPSKVALNQGEAQLYRADNGVLIGIKRTNEGYLVYAENGKDGLGGTPKAISEAQLPEVLTAISGKDFITYAQERKAAKAKPAVGPTAKASEEAAPKAEQSVQTSTEAKPQVEKRVTTTKPRITLKMADEKARKFVKDYDMLPISTRGKIQEAIISGNQFSVEENTINAACNIMTFRDVGISFSDIGPKGLYISNDGKRQIVVNPNTNIVKQTILHEITHELEGADGYDALRQKALNEVSETKQKATRALYEEYYKKIGKEIDEDIINGEITADYLSEKLGDSDFLRRYVGENLTFFQKAKRFITDFAAKLKNKDGFLQAIRIERIYDGLIKNTNSEQKAEVKTDIKYSISDQVLTEIKNEYKPTKREVISDQFLSYQIAFVNQQAGIENLGKRLGVSGIESKVQAARAAQAAAEEMLGGSQWNFDGTKKVGVGLEKIMKPIYKAGAETKQSFFTYLLHKHNISRMEQGKPVFGENVTAIDSAKAVAEFEKTNPEFIDIATKLNKYQDNLLQLRVDSGLITQESADTMRKMYPNYVPTFRDVEKAFGTGSLGGKNNLAVKQTIRKAKGGDQSILPIDIMIARQTIETVKAAKVNALANALYGAAEAKNDFSQIEISSREKVADIADTDYAEVKPKNNEVTFFRNGERITMKVSKEIFAGFEAFSPAAELSNPLVNAIRKVNNTFKRLVTSLNPAFLLRNTARDIQDAGMYSKYIKTFPKNYVKAISEIKNNGELWQRYKAMGGIQSSIFEFERGFIGEQNKFGLTKAEGIILNKGLQAMENANMFVEQLPRLAEFISSIEAGNTTEQALLDAADVTVNFSRTGKVTRSLNSTLIPFLNPAIQGFSKMIRSITSIKTARQLGVLLAKVAILGIIPQLLNQLMYDDDEDYQNLTDYVKENNYLFKIGNKFLKIPKGRVSSFIAGLVLRINQVSKGEEADWKGYVQNALTQITPVDAMSRTILSPFKDVATNTTWYGGTIEGAEFDSTAPAKRYDESTSSIAIGIGKILNYSPKKINYLLDQYSGVIGDILLPATTAKAEQDFFSGNFLVSPITSNKLSATFYDKYDKINYKKTEGDAAAAMQIKYLNKSKAAISELYKQKSIIHASNLSDKDKIAQTEAIQILINKSYQTALSDLPIVTKAIGATSGIEDTDMRYTEAIRLVYGAERALKEYNSAVFDKASTLNYGGVDYETFYHAYFTLKSVESNKDINGEAVSGSRKEKIVNYLNTLGIPDEQKMLLLYSYGYTTTNKKTLAQYIMRLQISAVEREALAGVCGFKMKNGIIVL